MVEAVSGQKLGAYMQDNIFGPLGMDDTAFKHHDRTCARAWPGSISAAPTARFDARLELEIPQEPEFEMGGGGLYGTAGDYLKFVRMMLNQGEATTASRC